MGESLGVHVIPVELTDDYHYHLDTCFCPLADDAAVSTRRISMLGLQVLQTYIRRLIPVERDEARRDLLQRRRGRPNGRDEYRLPEVARRSHRHGFDTVETPLDEFVKAGGSEVPHAPTRRKRRHLEACAS